MIACELRAEHLWTAASLRDAALRTGPVLNSQCESRMRSKMRPKKRVFKKIELFNSKYLLHHARELRPPQLLIRRKRLDIAHCIRVPQYCPLAPSSRHFSLWVFRSSSLPFLLLLSRTHSVALCVDNRILIEKQFMYCKA